MVRWTIKGFYATYTINHVMGHKTVIMLISLLFIVVRMEGMDNGFGIA